MSEHKIEREAVLWAAAALNWKRVPDGPLLDVLVSDVLAGRETGPVIRIAIAYVEGVKNHLDTVLELETNLARATEELVSLRTASLCYRAADRAQRQHANTSTARAYCEAAEALDKALGAGPGGT